MESQMVSENDFVARSEAKVESDDKLGLVFRQSVISVIFVPKEDLV